MSTKEISEYYIESIQKVLKHIDSNIEADLSVQRMAEVACFSKYHFHRIFKGAVNETLANYVIRRRLEHSVALFKRQPELSVTNVALRSGFNSPEHFTRSFKQKFGITPREFRAGDPLDLNSTRNRKIYQELSESSFYHIYEESRQMEAASFSVELVQIPTRKLAFVSEVFGVNGMALVDSWNHLMHWAEDKHLLNSDSFRLAMSRDDIEVVPAEQYRLEWAIGVPEHIQPEGRVGVSELYAGTYATVQVKGDIHRVAQGWDYLYKHWLPRSHFRPVDEPAVEIFNKGPEEIGWEAFDLLLGFPVTTHR